MTMSNWIEIVIICTIFLAGGLIKFHSKKKVSDIEATVGLVRKSECAGDVIGVHEEKGEA